MVDEEIQKAEEADTEENKTDAEDDQLNLSPESEEFCRSEAASFTSAVSHQERKQ